MIKTMELLDENSCLNKANSDEPIFVLLARDPCAADVIRTWAYLRIARDINGANDPKISEAFAMADTMETWRKNRL